MNIILAANAGYFGTKVEKEYEKATAPYAVYIVTDARCLYLAVQTRESALAKAGRIALRRGWEWDDRTTEEA